MNEEIKSIPVPLVMRELINSNNMLLSNFQQELTNRVVAANQEMMKMLGISTEDGWELNAQTMTYIKKDKSFGDLPVNSSIGIVK
jgi:hypothetical protein